MNLEQYDRERRKAGLLIGSEIFYVLDEPLSDGRFKTLYRVREGNDV